MPAAVLAALNPDALQASDGRYYQRDSQGLWRHDGDAAQGGTQLELDATRERLQPALQQHAHALAAMPVRQPVTPEQQNQYNTQATYAAYGVAPNAATAAAIELALERTRAAKGIGAGDSALALQPDAYGQYSADSPVQHLTRDAEGAVRVAAITTAADLHRALDQLQAFQHASRSEHVLSEPPAMPLAFPADHRDFALFSAIQAQLPHGTSDDKTAEVLLAVKASGIERADELRKVTIQDDVAYVYGKVPGFHSATALDTPAPELREVLQKTEALDQRQAQELMQFQHAREQMERSQGGQVMMH